MENIHIEIKKYNLKELFDACEYFINVYINKEKHKENKLFYHFLLYFSNVAGHDGYMIKYNTYKFLLHNYFLLFLKNNSK